VEHVVKTSRLAWRQLAILLSDDSIEPLLSLFGRSVGLVERDTQHLTLMKHIIIANAAAAAALGRSERNAHGLYHPSHTDVNQHQHQQGTGGDSLSLTVVSHRLFSSSFLPFGKFLSFSNG